MTVFFFSLSRPRRRRRPVGRVSRPASGPCRDRRRARPGNRGAADGRALASEPDDACRWPGWSRCRRAWPRVVGDWTLARRFAVITALTVGAGLALARAPVGRRPAPERGDGGGRPDLRDRCRPAGLAAGRGRGLAPVERRVRGRVRDHHHRTQHARDGRGQVGRLSCSPAPGRNGTAAWSSWSWLWRWCWSRDWSASACRPGWRGRRATCWAAPAPGPSARWRSTGR